MLGLKIDNDYQGEIGLLYSVGAKRSECHGWGIPYDGRTLRDRGLAISPVNEQLSAKVIITGRDDQQGEVINSNYL